MKTPAALQPLIDDGVIDEVVRSLKSGKEATAHLVRSGSVSVWPIVITLLVAARRRGQRRLWVAVRFSRASEAGTLRISLANPFATARL
jgi:hypothetical protein